MTNQSQIQARYDQANTVQVKLKLNIKTDADILQRLEQVGCKQGYIKELIREDLKALPQICPKSFEKA